MSAPRRDLARVGVALLTALALGAAAHELPESARAVQGQVERKPADPLEREVAPAYAFGLDPTLALRAGEVLPRDAVFTVLVGGDAGSARDAQQPFTVYWLLPRRYTPDPGQAEWLVNYGTDASELGLALEVVADDVGRPGWQLLRVRR